MDRRLLRYRDLLNWRDGAAIIAIGLGNAVALVLLAVLIRIFFRTAGQYTTGEPDLPVLVGLIGLVALIQANLKAFEFFVPENISFRIVHKLRLELHDHMSAMAPRQIQHRSRGSLILRLTGDLTMLRTWISRGIGRGTIAASAVLGCLAVLAFFSWRMALVVGACFVIGSTVSMWFGGRLGQLTRHVRQRRSLLTSDIDEQVNALAVVQINGRSRREAVRLERLSSYMTRALTREAKLRGILRGVSAATGWMALIGALAVGLYELAAGRIDVPTVFVTAIVVRLMHGYVRSLALAHDYWRRAEVSRRKLEDFLNSSSRHLADPTKAPLTQNRATIVFEGISVPGALEGFSATVPAGHHVAITGASGAGKSTILQAVAQMVELSQGDIHIGEQSLSECRISTVMRKIGMVSPDLPLMRGTIRRNLTYRLPNATDEELNNLIDRCHLRPLIEGFPDGLEHWVTEGGKNLSVGMRQSIMLGRALIGSPPILLLDEALAPLDRDFRRHFRHVIGRHAATILHVTDDPEDIEFADIVWDIEKGRLKSVEVPREYLRRVSRQRANAQLVSAAG